MQRKTPAMSVGWIPVVVAVTGQNMRNLKTDELGLVEDLQY
jgi:hypothetical protein